MGEGRRYGRRKEDRTMTSKTIVTEVEPQFQMKGDDLIITLPGIRQATGSPSQSGKSRVLASTHGNVKLGELGASVGLNVYRKA
jgi:hypothetical protein